MDRHWRFLSKFSRPGTHSLWSDIEAQINDGERELVHCRNLSFLWQSVRYGAHGEYSVGSSYANGWRVFHSWLVIILLVSSNTVREFDVERQRKNRKEYGYGTDDYRIPSG